MIKKIIEPSQIELDQIMNIWYQANCDAHDFINKRYWAERIEQVRELIPTATLYVFIKANEIVAFIGLAEHFIAGLFVKQQYRGQGIGQQLLQQAMRDQNSLELAVYCDNKQAVTFYQKNNFAIVEEKLDPAVEAMEYRMEWKR
ncbi:putative acetyltransferase [Amphibacillus marinus]|uniref:Putative acetyltransferase n=1 Tax=Amphibacillus marinus TaxID=872970 RepID=A0A1H8LFU6_9BACI|nr:GNAT family N-acetyltransferase [Amphibacillus marinus]SEO03943.1 putative acetyltransferase [Amphibacillus marinus]